MLHPTYHKHTRSNMFIAALYIIARNWKEWINKMWNIYTMEYYSAVKKKSDHKICMPMNGTSEKLLLNEATQTQHDRYSMYSLISGY